MSPADSPTGILERFDDAWHQGTPPDIAAFLPPPGPLRLRTLAGLVHIDLEWRLKGNQTVRLEDYLRRYPELAGDDEALLQLIGTEYQLRLRREPALGTSEYLHRFPRHAHALHSHLRSLAAQAVATPPAANPPGDLDLSGVKHVGPYELLERVGGGGMGTVYKAQHRHLDRIVAVKFLRPERLSDPPYLARFRQEMKAVGRLNHPNIVLAHHAEMEGGLPYLVMEFLAGVDLARLVGPLGALSSADACELVRQAALGLQHAHEQGLVHRDLKPSNLLLTAEGKVKVLDFGLARLAPVAETWETVLTGQDQVMGTPDYMAPEQSSDSHQVTIRADLYSLGCTLYHLLAGQPPFPGPRFDTFTKKCLAHNHEPVPPLRRHRPDVPAELAALVEQRLLAKAPADRLATPAELAAALLPFTTGCDLPALAQNGPLAVPPPTVVGPAAATPTGQASGPVLGREQTGSNAHARRGRWLLAGVLGLAATLAIAFAWWCLTPRQPLRVRAMTVEGLRGARHLGKLGTGFVAVQLDDQVRLSVELSEPAYCYLIAFNPDGKDQLLFPYPAAGAKPPPRSAQFTYPQTSDRAFKFTSQEGPGLQAFVLVASRQPLPAYRDWKERQGPPPWQAGAPGDAWRFDEEGYSPLDRARGEEEALPIAPAFRRLCDFLTQGPEAHVVEAVAFPVKAFPGRGKGP